MIEFNFANIYLIAVFLSVLIGLASIYYFGQSNSSKNNKLKNKK